MSKKRWRHTQNKGFRKTSLWGDSEVPSRPGGKRFAASTRLTAPEILKKENVEPIWESLHLWQTPTHFGTLYELTFCQGKSSHRHWLGNSWSTSWKPPPQPPAATSSQERAGRGLSALWGCPHTAWLLPTTASRFDKKGSRPGLSLNVIGQSKMPVWVFPGQISYNANLFSRVKLTGAARIPQEGGLLGTRSLVEPPTGGRTRNKVFS